MNVATHSLAYTMHIRFRLCFVCDFDRSHMCGFFLIKTLLSSKLHCIDCCSIFLHTQYTLAFSVDECASFERSQMCAFLFNTLLSAEWLCIDCCSIFLHTQYTLGFWDGECVNIDRSQLLYFIMIHTLFSTTCHLIDCCNIFPTTLWAQLERLCWIRGDGGIRLGFPTQSLWGTNDFLINGKRNLRAYWPASTPAPTNWCSYGFARGCSKSSPWRV